MVKTLSPSVARHTPAQAKALFGKNVEFALLDVREQDEFSQEHMLLACCAPLSRLELVAGDLAPCRKAQIILVDSGQERCLPRAERAAELLIRAGYDRVGVLDGGIKAWREQNYVLVTGVGALSKAFGEFIEEKDQTPYLEPREAKALLDSGGKTVLIDVRPFTEYSAMNIPGAINAPGCEALYRFADIVPDDDTMVIVNCAGRTRSILGTQTLRNAGIPNPVAALKGGTMNWQLAGFTLDYGSKESSAAPSSTALASAGKRAEAMARRYGVSFVDAATLLSWQHSQNQRTLYCFDVRQPEEFEAGHLPGSRNAPGGQLIQATDEFAAVRNGRFVLVDDTEVRAVTTAHWLLQMGIADVHVLAGGLGGSGLGGRLRKGQGASAPLIVPQTVSQSASSTLHQDTPLPMPASCCVTPTISADELAPMLKEPAPPLLVNVGSSKTHRAGHIPGAVWVARSYLEAAHAYSPNAKTIIITADSGLHAALAAQDAQTLWKDANILTLRGGTASWTIRELPLENDMPIALCAESDVWYRPYQDINASPEAMSAYFD